MKLFLAIAMILFSTASARGGLEDPSRPKNSSYPMSVGSTFACVIDAEDVKCWGWGYFSGIRTERVTPKPKLVRPTQVSVGGFHVCALDAEGVKCWGDNDARATEVPPLKNPRQVESGHWDSCALDDEGVKCWGSGMLPPPPLQNPRQIAVAYDTACALDDGGVKCWGEDEYAAKKVPEFRNPTDLTSGMNYFCARDGERLKCWEDNSMPSHIGYLSRFSTPLKEESRVHEGCAFEAGRVSCLRLDRREVDYPKSFPASGPAFEFVHRFGSGSAGTCAITMGAVECWDDDGDLQKRIPDLELDPIYLWRNAFSPVRAEFASPLVELLPQVKNLPAESYFLRALFAPAIRTSESSVFEKELGPEFEHFLRISQKKLGYQDFADSLARTPVNELTRSIAFTAVHSALKQAEKFTSPEHQEQIAALVRTLGQVKAAPFDDARISTLTQDLDAFLSNDQILGRSNRVKFLLEILGLVSDWLKGSSPVAKP